MVGQFFQNEKYLLVLVRFELYALGPYIRAGFLARCFFVLPTCDIWLLLAFYLRIVELCHFRAMPRKTQNTTLQGYSPFWVWFALGYFFSRIFPAGYLQASQESHKRVYIKSSIPQLYLFIKAQLINPNTLQGARVAWILV